VNPPSAPTPEPVVSLPLGAVALGVLLTIGAVALLVLLLTRRRRSPARPTGDMADALWLASLLDGIPQAALIVNASGQLVLWNAMATRSLALTGPSAELPLSLSALVTRVMQTATAETTEIADPRTPERRLRVTASPLREQDGNGALILAETSTETARSAESYRRLISAVTHELRTPLTAILGHADILGSCHPAQDEALWRRSRDFIASEAERLARLVEDLLTLSRLDLTPLQRQPINLRAVAEEAISTLFQAAEARGVQLALQSPRDLPRVLADRDRLYQVFLNLLDNAIKYSPAGGEAIVRLSLEGDAVQAQVCDNGAGIAPQDLPYVFDPLYRGQNVRDAPGTGLGLNIVRTILEQHGATIGVQSAPGHGATFHFCLPCVSIASSSP